LETQGPRCHGKQAAVERRVCVLACLAEGLGSRATARVFEGDAPTLLQGVVETAAQWRTFSRYGLGDVHVKPGQRDVLSAVLRAVKDGESRATEAITRLARAPPWVWAAITPGSKLLVGIEVGPRTRTLAPRVVPQVVQPRFKGLWP
jgi:hypothetical protein